jgi:hypothetical protein
MPQKLASVPTSTRVHALSLSMSRGLTSMASRKSSANQFAASRDAGMNTRTTPVGRYSSVFGGFRIDGSVTKFWATKTQAIAAAKSIGWPVKSVQPCYTNFQSGWTLGWGNTKPGMITKVEWETLSNATT